MRGNLETLNLRTDSSCRCSENTDVLENGPFNLKNLKLWVHKHTEKKPVCSFGVFIRQNNSSKARHYRSQQFLDHQDRFTEIGKLSFMV